MSERPIFRLTVRDKTSGEFADAGAVWASPFAGVYNVRPVTEPSPPDSPHKRVPLATAITSGNFYITLEDVAMRDKAKRKAAVAESEEF